MSQVLRTTATVVLLCLAVPLLAQDDDVSLGDLARSVRKTKSPEEQKVEEKKVIDNDNFSIMMDKAESARLNGKPVFSIDPVAKIFTMTSTDGTCSLSFDAKATALSPAPYISSDLPQDELVKLEGPARISDDVLEVSVHNGTGWELKEIVVGLTVIQPSRGAEIRDAALTPTTDSGIPTKIADSTVLYHLKGTGAPDSTATFRGNLGGGLVERNSNASSGSDSNFNFKDWHWAIVAARGIPPAPPTVPAPAVTLASPGPLTVGGAGLPGVSELGISEPGISAQPAAPNLNSTPAPPVPAAK
jgi:hypothetical protein